MKTFRELLFPTPIYQKEFPDAKNLNKHLAKHIIAWSKKEKGETKTNSGGGWHSPTDMHERDEYQPLVKHLSVMVEELFKDYGLEKPFFIGNMWCNINYPGAYNKVHIHPNSTWSGAYYIKIPKDSGCIWVEDPRPGPQHIMPRRLNNLPRQLWRVVKYPMTEGSCIMFPSWVPHGVESNDSKEKGTKGWRISVSFNFIQGNGDSTAYIRNQWETQK
jgi:uncharacterized protein (TIGR02466 family)